MPGNPLEAPDGEEPPELSVALDALRGALHRAAHHLPAQRPLGHFVHHNPLHADEGRPFHQVVEERFVSSAAEPYASEQDYRAAFSVGRILDRDLRDVIALHVPTPGAACVGVARTRSEAWYRLLRWLPAPEPDAALTWRANEGAVAADPFADLPRDAAERLLLAGPPERVLAALVRRSGEIAARAPAPSQGGAARPRDAVVGSGYDPDALVHPELIGWCAAFLGRSFAGFAQPDADAGFFVATLRALAAPSVGAPGWTREARRRARGLLREGATAERAALCVLASWGVGPEEFDRVIGATLGALPGWAGMFATLESHPETAPAAPLGARLVDFLAIRLLLDEAAGRAVARRAGRPWPPPAPAARSAIGGPRLPVRATQVFAAARLLGIPPDELGDRSVADRLLALLVEADDLARRRLWHLAFELRFRRALLGAIQARPPRAAAGAALRLATCIDDRMESLRRHVEEIDPEIQTLGIAGNFGLKLRHRRFGERGWALSGAPGAPVVAEADESTTGAGRSRLPLLVANLRREAPQGLLVGTLPSLLGVLDAAPLAARLVAPWLGRVAPTGLAPLQIRDPGSGGPLEPGVAAAALRPVLRQIGGDGLVVVLGHGASSVNNPYAAGYDCGACGGRVGGPHARVFARLANDPAVRAALAARGQTVPATAWFVGGAIDTTTDDVVLFDLDAVPAAHRPALERARAVLERARGLDALERGRRFEALPLFTTPAAALAEAQRRGRDLSEPRPEYNHAGNAAHIIGRRSRTRGLFLDRRAFLTSYDPAADDDGAALTEILGAVGPVGIGINLEYYFSTVDPLRYGADSKLPQNVVGLIGVMDGARSDLRTGLVRQMTEAHEPLRLLHVIEAPVARVEAALARLPAFERSLRNDWFLLAVLDPDGPGVAVWGGEGFVPFDPDGVPPERASRSRDAFEGRRGALLPGVLTGPEEPS